MCGRSCCCYSRTVTEEAHGPILQLGSSLQQLAAVNTPQCQVTSHTAACHLHYRPTRQTLLWCSPQGSRLCHGQVKDLPDHTAYSGQRIRARLSAPRARAWPPSLIPHFPGHSVTSTDEKVTDTHGCPPSRHLQLQSPECALQQ